METSVPDLLTNVMLVSVPPSTETIAFAAVGDLDGEQQEVRRFDATS